MSCCLHPLQKAKIIPREAEQMESVSAERQSNERHNPPALRIPPPNRGNTTGHTTGWARPPFPPPCGLPGSALRGAQTLRRSGGALSTGFGAKLAEAVTADVVSGSMDRARGCTGFRRVPLEARVGVGLRVGKRGPRQVLWIKEVCSLLACVAHHARARSDGKSNLDRIGMWVFNIQHVMEGLKYHFQIQSSPMPEFLQPLVQDILLTIKKISQLLEEFSKKSLLGQFSMSWVCKRSFDDADRAVLKALNSLDMDLDNELLLQVRSMKPVVLEVDTTAEEAIKSQIDQDEARKARVEKISTSLTKLMCQLEAKGEQKVRLKNLQIDKAELTFLSDKPIAIGGFSSVYRAVHKHEVRAVKTASIKALLICGDEAQLEKVCARFMKELEILAQMHSPFIVSVKNAFISPEEMGLVMEYAERGSLRAVLQNVEDRSTMTMTMKHTILQDVAAGECYLYEHRVQHRDLKSPNILITHSWRAKVSDFGLSKTMDDISDSGTRVGLREGTLFWKAPELLQSGGSDGAMFTEKSDVYSYGVVVWEVMCGKGARPWQGYRQSEIIQRVTGGATLKLTRTSPLPAKKLMEECWRKQPCARPSFAEITTMLQENAWG
ncbi:unnamed protein product [Discosporangium mesarthrocarpum]